MNSFNGAYFTPEYFYRKENERKALRRVGSLCGAGMLLYVFLQNAIALLIQAAGLWDKYTSDTFFQCGADIFMTFIGVLLPFTVINRFLKKHTGVSEPLSFERKVSTVSFFTAVVAGAGLCMAANVVSSVFIAIMSVFGFKLTSPDVPMPEGYAGFLLSFVRVVIVAAMAEEIALRGYIMGNIKKYGDVFAIGASAVLFAIMHGNLVQAPFALLAGFTIGYFTVKTGTLWTGILIHAINNFISLLLSYIIDTAGQETGTVIYGAAIYGLGFTGIICALIFVYGNRESKLSEGETVLSPGEKVIRFFFNLPMITAFLLMLYITSNYIEFGW